MKIKPIGLLFCSIVLYSNLTNAFGQIEFDTLNTMHEKAFLSGFQNVNEVASVTRPYYYPGLDTASQQPLAFAGLLNDISSSPGIYAGLNTGTPQSKLGFYFEKVTYYEQKTYDGSRNSGGLGGGLWFVPVYKGLLGFSVQGTYNGSDANSLGSINYSVDAKQRDVCLIVNGLLKVRSPLVQAIKISGSMKESNISSMEDKVVIAEDRISRNRQKILLGKRNLSFELLHQRLRRTIRLGMYAEGEQNYDSSWKVENTIYSRILKDKRTGRVGFLGALEAKWCPVERVSILYGGKITMSFDTYQDNRYPAVWTFSDRYLLDGARNIGIDIPLCIEVEATKSLMFISMWKASIFENESHYKNSGTTISNKSISREYQTAPLSLLYKIDRFEILFIPQFPKIVYGLELRMHL